MNAQPHWGQSLLGDDESLHTLMLPVSVLFTTPTAARRDQMAWEAMKAYGRYRPTKLHVAGNRRHFDTPSLSTLHFLHIESVDDVKGCPGAHRIVAEDVSEKSEGSTEVVNALLALLVNPEPIFQDQKFRVGGPIIEPALWLTFFGWPNAIVLRSSDEWDFSEELLELARS